MSYGICQLTGKSGKFVRCHLLPKALTSTPSPGEPRVESGDGLLEPRRRFDGWYDKKMVTRAGEDILALYDDKAIPILRKHGLVWSSPTPLTMPDPRFDDGIEGASGGWQIGSIEISPEEGRWLRLFYLSLLWRAAVTDHLGFYTISLSKERVETLRKMLLARKSEPATVFPITLYHLNTNGGWHNTSPTSREMDFDGNVVTTYRFYMDGLIAIIHDEETDNVTGRVVDQAVGASEKLFLMTRPFEGSHQEERINSIMHESMQSHSEKVDQILSTRKQFGIGARRLDAT